MAEEWKVRGGGFVVGEVDPADIFTPEEIRPEQKEIAGLAREFVEKEVFPKADEIEKGNLELTVELLKQMGELGLLGAEIPEEYGGMGVDMTTAALLMEEYSRTGSFGVSVGAHTGIGTLPIVYFGNEAQKKAYLPDLATGKRLAAYALTEPMAGSDALGARTTARLSEDGRHYLLKGQKQWITNSGFADVFVVYAKVDGEKFTAFIVERDWKGLSVGPEVKKMGIKGSSTRMLFLDDVPVPAENVLGEVGKGARIAFTILDIGRLKLGIGSLGSQREVQKMAASYAKGREQFGQPIARFPLIQEKLAFMAAEAYALESAAYRTTGLLDRRLHGLDQGQATRVIAEFALECSALKVFGSEVLGRTVDEAVQIHGGYGYMEEFPVERAYRDARINRIFEGTNEINRLLIVETLVRQAMAGLPVLQAATDALKEAGAALEAAQGGKASWFPQGKGDGPAEKLLALTRGARILGLALAGQAFQKAGQDLEKEQELVGRLADLILYLFAAESAFLRVAKGHEEGLLPAQIFAQEAGWRMARAAQEAVDILGLEKGWRELALSLADVPVTDLKGLRRALAEKVLAAAP